MMSKKFSTSHMPYYATMSGAVILFLYLPLLILILYSFNQGRSATAWEGFTWSWYISAMKNADLYRATVNSILVAAVAMPLSTMLALPAALAFERRGWFPGKSLCEGMVAMPLIVPEILTAIVTLIFFQSINLNAGLLNVILAHVVFCIPFAMFPIRARLKESSTLMEDAARDLYSSEWDVFFRVTLPLLKPAIISALTLSFVVSLDDFLITFMVAPPGATTLPVYLYGMLRLGISPEANAAASLLLVLSVALVAVSMAFTHRKRN